jgi:hypothetical protein
VAGDVPGNENAEGLMFRLRVLLTVVLVVVFALLAVPPAAAPGYSGNVVGKIAAVTPEAFSLWIAGDREETVHFLFGLATRIEGEMKTGAYAGVEYFALGDSHFATHVIVDSPATDFALRPRLR